MSAIQVETDSHNTHMLLGGLLLCVQDSVSFEDTECGASDVHSTSAKDERNLLSSGERGHIKFKFYISPYFLENSFLICLMMPFIILHLSHFYQTFLSHFTQKQNPIKKYMKNQLSACSERSAYSIASGASSYGNSSTATVSNEPSSIISEDMMPDDFDGANGKTCKSFHAQYQCSPSPSSVP